jgi:hypothetical protein
MHETALGEIMTEPPVSTAAPTRWPEPAPAPKTYPCPDCDRVFDKPQGLGAHRFRAHGYRKNGKKTFTTVTKATPTVDDTIAAIFPKGIPVDREILTAVLNFMEAHDRLVELATGTNR